MSFEAQQERNRASFMAIRYQLRCITEVEVKKATVPSY